MNNNTNTAESAKRFRISDWMRTAISLPEAKERGLIQISRLTMIRNWTCREALYDHAQQAKAQGPELVIIAPGRAALFGIPSRR